MKKQLSIILLSIFLSGAFLISSCSIEKRIYRKGYHVEWNGARKAEAALQISENETAVSEIQEKQTDEIFECIDSIPSAPLTQGAETKTEKNNFSVHSSGVVTDSKTSETLSKEERRADFVSGFKKGVKMMAPSADGQLLSLAVASMVLGILSLIAYYGAFVLGVLAIIFGAVALHTMRKNPGVYRGRRMAIAGVVCGIISLAIITTIIIVI